MDYNQWLKLLDIATRYANENKLRLCRIDAGMADYGGVAFFSNGKFKSCKNMIQSLKDEPTPHSEAAAPAIYVCNLGHQYRNNDGLWSVFKHGAGWVLVDSADIPVELK